VDDNPDNIKAAEECGIKAVMIARPWNQNKIGLAESLIELETIAGE